MFPELVTRPDLEVFLPPIGGTTVYMFGDVERLGEPDTMIACRVHDECNGSDVFGSDICTCRPYLSRAGVARRANYSRRCTAGSPRASTPSISKRRRRCLTSWREPIVTCPTTRVRTSASAATQRSAGAVRDGS